MKTDLSKYNNSWYKPGGKIKRLLWYLINAIFFNSPLHINFIKIFLLRLFGAKVGTGVILKPFLNIKYPWFLEVGDYTWIGEKVWIDNLATVSIGSNCCLSQGALLLCGNHNYKKETFDLIIKPITLKNGVWIGAKAIVCSGVTCNNYSVLAVGAVATANLNENSIYQGNPAIFVRSR